MSETDDLERFLSEDCAECGTPGCQRHLSAVGGCATCIAEDPVPVYIPVRNVLMGALNAAKSDVERPRYSPFTGVGATSPQPFGECYLMASGAMVHVRPGCQCKR